MCCRFHLSERHLRELLAQLGVAAPEGYRTRYNIAPGGPIFAVRNSPRVAARELFSPRWGLTPAWAQTDEPAARLVNARAETLASKPSFRDAVRARRCLIPASGFFEWETVGRGKRPWLFRWQNETPFGLAGLWETWQAPDGRQLESCAVITTEPNELMRPIHHRMPVMLTPAHFDRWLDPSENELEKLAPLFRPPPADLMSAIPVNPCVGNVHHDAPDCLESAVATPDPQFSLGLE